MDDLAKMLERLKAQHSNAGSKSAYKCSDCRDTGFVMRDIGNGSQIAQRCKCYIANRTKERMERSGLSEELNKKTFNSFDTQNMPQLVNAKVKAQQYVQGFTAFEHERCNSIMFSGQSGAGKTHIGTAICSSLIGQGIEVVYMAYRNAITKIKQILIDEIGYERELDKYMRARVLYIDDLLKGKVTESDINILYEIINYRYMNNKPIIISTEKSQVELLEFDEAIGSRIIEMCRGNIIQLRGKELNYRLS